jgi:hypothetical protein
MGLDMYAYSAKAGILSDADQVDFGEKLFSDGKAIEGVNTDLGYWRKFNNLHGWMEALYRKKGGKDESFNCNTVRLMPEDIDQLEKDAKAGENLEPTEGFFFGGLSTLDADDQREILEFVRMAREVFAAGGAVAYDSWW